ncbi:uncharacterized protein PFL1_00902 [Pseudozyma flocculosa PF-1]|uniref:Related to UPF0047 domain protein n=1 Tax=Pseudozyma flocculosa TaxID=84751 RepID=A0A5C3F3G4_9BASI|nr:uncharacterized protein PFL1_00902 [Pseudozyma flocculosa PF-1]EPQ31569.1 hypothetical protein PFL1_00902 [Pseudozyma flocculosa PF-1]SPO38640.1 related to UPF0047 domain protein [Pseudozyma flocculosa]
MTSPSSSDPTLYAASPHARIDGKEARRRLRRAHRAGHYTDPTYTTLLILACALVYWFLPLDLLLHPFSSSSSSPSLKQTTRMPWQKTITLSSRTKGCHLVTNEVLPQIEEGIKGVKIGMLTLFIQHTSAALTTQENFDSDVRKDLDMALDHIVPESLPWRHTDEGPDDSASHTKTSLIGPSISIPITDGRLNTGTWQGIYLCEFRRMAHKRKIVATVLP